MEFMNEYGLLVAIATPVGLICLINVLLALGGEKGTLLLPSVGSSYPSVLADAEGVVVAEPEAAPEAAVTPPIRPAVPAGFDETDEMLARQAA